MPGFTIDTRSEGADENCSPHLELFYSDGQPASMIQKTVVESVNGYDVEMYNTSDNTGEARTQQVRTVPTTIAKDGDYEIQRWEKPTHADRIREVLDGW